jgi:hypothetical protein
MPVTVERVDRHVREWSKRLAPFQTRSNWPPHLFHTCQLEVALEIIRAGRILCRHDVPRLICDVANQGALWNKVAAHKYVRLYFRPRNSFHLKTEGIKATGDPNRVDPHMSIPITFAFDFVQVITSQGSGFVAGNFARSGAIPSDNDQDFDSLPFDLIYQDAPTLPDYRMEIHNWRMSEVVVGGQLPFSKLSYIVCRTIHEERTLRHLLGTTFAPRVIVEQRGSIFMRRGIFIDEIYLEEGMMHLKFHGPTGFTKETYAIKVICHDRGTVTDGLYSVNPGISYRFAGLQASAAAIWRIEFEGCLAYNGPIPSISGLVVA